MGAKATARFEEAFARWLGVRHAFAFWKGRVGIYATLRALGVGPGDEVILPGYTCVVAVNPVVYLGAQPVFLDIEPTTYNIDPSKIEPAITKRTRLIVAQHTFGYPAEMDTILSIATRYGLPVMEDSCMAVGSTYKGRKTGTLSVAACWSTQWNKTFTTGLGGLATTNDDNLADRIRHLCRQEAYSPGIGETALLGLERWTFRTVVYPHTTALTQAVFRYLSDAELLIGSSTPAERCKQMKPDFFKLMSSSQARSGLRQLRRLEANVAHRRRMARLYDELLRQRGWPLPQIPAYLNPVLVRYPVRVADKQRALAGAARARVELGAWFDSVLHGTMVSPEMYGYRPGSCPLAEQAVREVVNLPTHPRVTEQIARNTVDYICRLGPPPGRDSGV